MATPVSLSSKLIKKYFLGLFILTWTLILTTSSAAAQAHLWSKRFGDTSLDLGQSVTIDGSGNVFVTGAFGGTANFGGGDFTSAGAKDIFLAKYDASGTHLWSQRFGDTSDDFGLGITVDGSGNIFLVGSFRRTVDFGGGGLTSASDVADIFLAKYDTNGTRHFSFRLVN